MLNQGFMPCASEKETSRTGLSRRSVPICDTLTIHSHDDTIKDLDNQHVYTSGPAAACPQAPSLSWGLWEGTSC